MKVKYRIGEAARLSGLSTPAIRFYESKGLLPPAGRTGAGYRQYDDDAIRRLRLIRNARALGLPLDEVQALISGSHSSDCGGYVTQLQAMIARQETEVASRLAGLLRLQTELRSLSDQISIIDFTGAPIANPHSCTCCPLLDEPTASETYCAPGGSPTMFKNVISEDDLLDVLSCDLGARPPGAPTATDLAPHYNGHELRDGALVVLYDSEASVMLAAFAAAESRCCSGLDWAVAPAAESVELRIKGSPVQLEALAAMWSSREVCP